MWSSLQGNFFNNTKEQFHIHKQTNKKDNSKQLNVCDIVTKSEDTTTQVKTGVPATRYTAKAS